ncbi:endolytic transglycosylase MltG [Paenibacillus sp. N1-5-1-14]|uniref:endolytic transglycosylase MltG n=1 Tax=Paenibacillus radicibacter TaxID=2972488 RepID=UPI002158F16F|nr:endolytic transglycosylase MltG [Paenibacillus radicibacter]MCR8644077.1 endolytic transglycosylase MltG [Paenibacillus radicibacter]
MEQWNEPKKKPKRTAVRVLLVIVILLLLTGAGAFIYVNQQLKPMPSQDKEVRVKIEQGMGARKIASLLEQNGLIRNDAVFMGYLKWNNEGSQFKAGEYAMNPGMTFDEIIDKLNKGLIVKEDMIRLTIPEGYTILQIFDKLKGMAEFDADAFLKQVEDPKGLGLTSEVAQQIPNNDKLRHVLEGYLFPETYEFKKGSTEKDLIVRMTQELDNKLKELPAGWEDQLKKLGVTFHEMMTIASLVEREVAVDKERGLVAGVIYNRINKKMPLQIDATIQYLFDKPKERLFLKDLKVESPYNTYLNAGLPPGPIGAPSLDSIRAALYPEASKYLFYVTKKDGSKEHLFAETFEEHQRNNAESKK